MKKRAGLLLVLVFLGVLIYAQDSGESRGFYIDVGGGWSFIKYPEPFNTNVKNVAKNSAVTRITVDFDLSIGGAVIQNLFVVGTLGGIGDSLSASNTLTLSTFLLGPGIKFYPLPSKKYLQIGLDLGYSFFTITDSRYTESEMGPKGFAAQISAAADFDSTLTGPALLLGGKFYLGILDGEAVTSFSIFAKFVYKGGKK